MKTGRATPEFGENEDGVLPPPPAPAMPPKRINEPSSFPMRSRERSLTPWDGAGEDTATEIDDDKLRAALANLRAGMAQSSVVSKRDAEGTPAPLTKGAVAPVVEKLPAIPVAVSRLLESGGILDESVVLGDFESAPNTAPSVVGPDTEPHHAPRVLPPAPQTPMRASQSFARPSLASQAFTSQALASQAFARSDAGTVESASSPLDSDPFPDIPIVVNRPATSNRVMLMAGIGFLMIGLVGAVLLSPGFISRVRTTNSSAFVSEPSEPKEKSNATAKATTIAHSVIPIPSSESASAVQPETPPSGPAVHQVLIARAVVEEPPVNEKDEARAEQNGIEPPAPAPTLRAATHSAKVHKAVKPKKIRIKPKARRAPSGSTSPQPERGAVLAQPPAAPARAATDPDATLPPTN